MSWRPANSLVALQREVNASHPDRPKQADGMIGDTAHQAQGSASDHNPNANGVVTAWDITTADFTDAMAEWLRHIGPTDGRIKYIIYMHKITSAVHHWEWAPYNGSDPHTGHIHLSVSASPAEYDRTDPWHYAESLTTGQDDDMTPEQDTRLKNVEKMLTELGAPRNTAKSDRNPNRIDLGDVLTKIEGGSVQK